MGNTILIVDDEEAALNLLEMYFSEAGFTVYTAVTGKDAISLAFKHLPDCFLLDYHLGCDTALAACQAIRSHERLKNSPIVVLSGDPSQAAHSYDACQADVFLDKDKSYPEIISAVKRQLRRAESAGSVLLGSDLTLDTQNMCIIRKGKPKICLSPEQFRFFYTLFIKSPRFVGEDEICGKVFMQDCTVSLRKALNMAAYRLRIKLGPQLARRVKNSKTRGWVYIQPRHNKKPSCKSVKTAAKPG